MMNFTGKVLISGLCLVSSNVMALGSNPSSVITHEELLHVMGGLLLVLGVIVALSWLVKRVQGLNLGVTQGFRTLATTALGPKEKLMLVKVGDQHLLIGVGTSSVSLVYDFGKQLPEGFNLEPQMSFAQLFKSVARKQNHED